MILTLLGITLFVLGFNPILQKWDPFKGFLFWVSGVVLIIPGIFYLVRIVQAYKATDDGERTSILREIPEL